MISSVSDYKYSIIKWERVRKANTEHLFGHDLWLKQKNYFYIINNYCFFDLGKINQTHIKKKNK